MADFAFIGCGVVDLLCGCASEITGVEDESDGGLRVFLGPRYEGIYVVVESDATEAQRVIRDAWRIGGHVLIRTPPSDCLMQLTSRGESDG